MDYFDSQGLATEPTAFDGRSDYDAFINVGIPAGGLFTGAEEHQDRGGGGDLRRHRGRSLRPVLPPGLRRHRQPVEPGPGPDVRTPRPPPPSGSLGPASPPRRAHRGAPPPRLLQGPPQEGNKKPGAPTLIQ